MPKAAVLPAAPPPVDGARLTIADVCDRLNIDRRTVRALIDARLLRFVKVGRVYRFRAAWVDDYIDRSGGR